MLIFYSTFVVVDTASKYMRRCLLLAARGLGFARPNPSVGCVIVCDDKIIGEGYTSTYGGPHAEVNALNAVKDKSLLSQSTLYVTMEPCSHFGKTPPCSDAIIKSGIQKVVIGLKDVSTKVNGAGVQRMKAAGIDVVYEALNGEVGLQHKRFNCFEEKRRPFFVLKWAASKDGFLAPLAKDEKRPVWLSNIYSRQLVHKWRSKEQAIMVGAKTVIEDQPKLDVRDWGGLDPTIIVFDPKNKLDLSNPIFRTERKCVLINTLEVDLEMDNIVQLVLNDSDAYVVQICAFLHRQNIQSVFVEGGVKTLNMFIDAEVWDEAYVFCADKQLKRGVEAPLVNSSYACESYDILGDRLTVYSNSFER